MADSALHATLSAVRHTIGAGHHSACLIPDFLQCCIVLDTTHVLFICMHICLCSYVCTHIHMCVYIVSAALRIWLSYTVKVMQGTFLPANVAQQLDDMTSHATLKLAADKVKKQYAQLRTWRARLLKQSAEDLVDAVAHEDLAVEIENILTRYHTLQRLWQHASAALSSPPSLHSSRPIGNLPWVGCGVGHG